MLSDLRRQVEAIPYDKIIRGGLETPMVIADGSCYPNPGPGGFAAIIYHCNGVKLIRASVNPTTNNLMELRAIHEGIKYVGLKLNSSQMYILTDSEYCIKSITDWSNKWMKNGWKTAKGPVQNADEIKKIIKDIEDFEITVNFVHTRGHLKMDTPTALLNGIVDHYAGLRDE